ncbi:MAG: RNB domain-containing ribonuclease [Spirochaetales bacterium]|jgi:exoribonuclease-2|nr:RNB domain-containing ribonuclease [Spirochaetales bacterium]
MSCADEGVFRPGNLVIYKNYPARVVAAGTKIEILLPDKRGLSVRPKDILFLHTGPVDSLDLPEEPAEDIEAAWEILQGQTTTLPAFAEILYGAFTPAAALGVYRLLLDGLYLRGSPGELYVLSQEEHEKEAAAREAKKRDAEEWANFLNRIKASAFGGGGKIENEERRYLGELEAFALGKSAASRVLKELGLSNTPEAAHSLLLKLGLWDYTVNPYVSRFGLDSGAAYPPLETPAEEERLDLTGLEAFAIDDEDSDDPDDAISFDGGKLWVHVADPACVVRPGSPADLAARDLGATLYLPEKKIPMLPPQATALFGLGLREVSPALSFCVSLNEDGSLGETEIRLTKIRVSRMTYVQAQNAMDAPPFRAIYELTSRYRERRMRNGAVRIDLPEVKIRAAGGEVNIRPLAETDSGAMVTDAMLMAGEAAARFALSHGIPIPYATQEPPDSPGGGQDTPADMFELRKKLRPSAMRSSPSPHAGLGLELYARATSPLRRYLDLVVHQQLRAFLTGGGALSPDEITDRIGASDAVTGRVQKVERLSNLHWTLAYLSQNPDWRGRGIVVEKRGRLCTLILPDLGMETKVNLGRDVPLNGEVIVKVLGVDLAGLEARFEGVSEKGALPGF